MKFETPSPWHFYEDVAPPKRTFFVKVTDLIAAEHIIHILAIAEEGQRELVENPIDQTFETIAFTALASRVISRLSRGFG